MKKWTFTRCKSMNDCEEQALLEEELEQKHIHLLAGELCRKFSELPEKAQELFRKEIKEI